MFEILSIAGRRPTVQFKSILLVESGQQVVHRMITKLHFCNEYVKIMPCYSVTAVPLGITIT